MNVKELKACLIGLPDDMEIFIPTDYDYDNISSVEIVSAYEQGEGFYVYREQPPSSVEPYKPYLKIKLA